MAEAPVSPGGGSHESGDNGSPRSNVREQDRYLQIPNISWIMKKALVCRTGRVISARGIRGCRREKRKTINGDDLLRAMATLGFEDYIDPLNVYLTSYREVEGDTKGKSIYPSSKKEAQPSSNSQIAKLSEIQQVPEAQLDYIIEAWQQIVECRRMLKWSYAYGYYLPENEHAKRQFFEYIQGEAESGLERLHQCAEKELQQFLNADGKPSEEFVQFRPKLALLTSVTKSYFENLVSALENGLKDVDSEAATSSKNEGSSQGKTGKAKGTSRAGGSGKSADSTSHWLCQHCTYANAKSTTICQACHQHQ